MKISDFRLTTLFNKIANFERDEIPEQEQRKIARSFFLICATNFFSKFADLLSSPKITLTWLLQALGSPTFLISLLVPIRESGSMLPQLLLAGLVNSSRNQVRLYQAGAIVQALALAGIVACALSLTGAMAGWIVVALIAVFSLGRCLCSLVSKAVLGSVIPKSLRGQTTGWSATIAGLSTCMVAAYLYLQVSSQSVSLAVVLLAVASICWLLALITYGYIKQSTDDATKANTDGQTFSDRLVLLREDENFRRFVIVRALLVSSALVTPYYILLSGKESSTIQVLGGLLLASGLAKLLSSVVWGRVSDRSSRTALIVAAVMVFALGLITVSVQFIKPQWLTTTWFIPVLYFGLEIAHQGVRVARKTYVVDMATGETRVDYVALSNSLIGALLLAAGVFLGLLSLVFSPIWLIAGLSVLSLTGALLAMRLHQLS